MLSWADVVYLKDGSVIKGKVIEAVPGVSYKIKTGDGSIFVFEVDKVERVKFEEVPETEKKVVPVEKKGTAVVYLKNGSVIKGEVIETVPGVSYKIKTADGSIFVFEVDKVERVKFEEVPEVEKRVAPVEEKRPVYVKEKPAWPQEVSNGKSYLKGILGFGGGGDDLPTGLVVSGTGKAITLNAGGGYEIGGGLGYKIDLSSSVEFGASYRSSGLSENVSNAEGSFKRIPITVIYTYNFPIKTKDSLSGHFYLGGGAGMYMSPNAHIEGLGIELDYDYANSMGFHGLVGWERIEKPNVFVELRYVKVNYEFKRGTINGYNAIPSSAYKNIDGSSIDLILGVKLPF